MEKVQDENQEQAPKQPQAKPEAQKSLFDGVENVNEAVAVDILVQIGRMAQRAGILELRDSVLLAKAIDTLAQKKA